MFPNEEAKNSTGGGWGQRDASISAVVFYLYICTEGVPTSGAGVCGCMSHTDWLEQHESIFSPLWTMEDQDPGSHRFESIVLLGLQVVMLLLCPRGLCAHLCLVLFCLTFPFC